MPILLGACRYEKNLHLPPPGAPIAAAPYLQVQRKYDPVNGALVSEASMMLSPDRPPLRHGKAVAWYSNGAKQWEREYRLGEPTGTWRSWYDTGVLRSEASFVEGHAPTTMTFWHPNGEMSARGPARKGARTGAWKFWHPDGRPAEEGSYVASLREGAWQRWSADGTERFDLFYEHNICILSQSVRESGEQSTPESAVPAPGSAVPTIGESVGAEATRDGAEATRDGGAPSER